MLVRLEMGEQRMTIGSVLLPAWLFAVIILGHLFLGAAIGTVHFSCIRRTAGAIADGHGRLAAMLIAGRLALTGGTLVLVSMEGATPLIATAAGVMAGRFVIMRRVHKVVR